MNTILQDVVFLFDVDNTLLDNDAVQADLSAYLTQTLGIEIRNRYWALFEQLRSELGYADYLGALQRYRLEALHDPRILGISTYLIDYPFAQQLYAGALDVLSRCSMVGPTVILSDGDVVFQPLKIRRSGIWDAVNGRVLVYVHKEQMLGDVEKLYPARRYVMVDDKVRILAALKATWGDKVLTVFPKQGHYAVDAKEVAKYPTPDFSIDHVGDLQNEELLRSLLDIPT